LGGSRAALEAWRRGDRPTAESRARFVHPEPRIAAGKWLARNGARAMIDLSDGLGGDAGHLAAASAVLLSIDLDLLPVHPSVESEARLLRVSSPQFAAEGGEDYELLVALPSEFAGSDAFAEECGLALTRIGSVQAGQGVAFRLKTQSIALRGFDHFG
jgi:thiamine-monophosphate kinase